MWRPEVQRNRRPAERERQIRNGNRGTIKNENHDPVSGGGGCSSERMGTWLKSRPVFSREREQMVNYLMAVTLLNWLHFRRLEREGDREDKQWQQRGERKTTPLYREGGGGGDYFHIT